MQSHAVKKMGKGLALIGMVSLAIILFVMSVINTWSVSTGIFPNDMVRAGLNVALYDFGMIVWLLVFFFLCESVAQYVVALAAFLVNALGVLAINLLSINLSQMLATVDSAAMGQYTVYVVEFIFIWHLVGALAHIVAHPWAWGQIERGIKRAEVITKAHNEANALMDAQAGELAEEVAANIHRDAVAEIRGNGGGKSSKVMPALAPISTKQPALHNANGNGHGATTPGFTNPPHRD